MSRVGTRGRLEVVILASAIVAAVVVAGLAVFLVAGGGSDDGSATIRVEDQESDTGLPAYALQGSAEAALAYQFALERPDVMLWMPCYCGCGGHSGHRNARDCFIKSTSSSGDIQFEVHGSECNVCVDIAVRARELTMAGRSLSDIRAAVDQEFGDIGPGTDTPLPPE